jgi:hypothetical protein
MATRKVTSTKGINHRSAAACQREWRAWDQFRDRFAQKVCSGGKLTPQLNWALRDVWDAARAEGHTLHNAFR